MRLKSTLVNGNMQEKLFLNFVNSFSETNRGVLSVLEKQYAYHNIFSNNHLSLNNRPPLSNNYPVLAQIFEIYKVRLFASSDFYRYCSFCYEYVRAREDEGKRGNPPYRPYSHRNPSKVIFRSPARSSVPRGLSDSQSYILNFTHVDS